MLKNKASKVFTSIIFLKTPLSRVDDKFSEDEVVELVSNYLLLVAI